MACYHPIKAHYRIDDFSGKKDICFDEPVGGLCQKDGKLYPFKIELPCGQCIGCRLEYSRQWAVRCVLEAMQYEHNYLLHLHIVLKKFLRSMITLILIMILASFLVISLLIL